MTELQRRGFSLGQAPLATSPHNDSLEQWQQGFPVLLNGQCANTLAEYQDSILQTEKFVAAVLEGEECDSLLLESPYHGRLNERFQSMGSVYNEGDDQEIDMLLFDAVDGEQLLAEDLWMKASWLSFHDDDASLRFRFSFGIDHEQDVSADPLRQQLAAELTDAVFPESGIITRNPALEPILKTLLNGNTAHFVERIIYFNAPNGGAYLHHDLERGHAGVVFAQLSGSTFWLALPKQALLEEISAFVNIGQWPESFTPAMIKEVTTLVQCPSKLATELESFANDTLIHLINETEAFVQHLISKGHSRTLKPGDIILLPQADSNTCCWHSVFCLGDEIGQALSFAIR